MQTIRRGNIGHFQTTNTCSKLDCEILLIAGKTAIFLHNRKLNNCSARPLNIYLIQRQRIWKPAAITNLLTRNLEMQMFATQLGGQVVPTSFKPVPFTLLKDPPPRTKGTGFCCLSLFFLPWFLCHAAFTWRQSCRQLQLRCNNCTFCTKKFNKLSRLSSRAWQTQGNWNKQGMCMLKECITGCLWVSEKSTLGAIFKNVCYGSSKTPTGSRNTTNLRVSSQNHCCVNWAVVWKNQIM